MKESAEHADSILEDTISAIRPEVQWTHHAYSSSLCPNFKPEGEKTGSVELWRAIMTKISKERRGSLLGVIERHWKKKGYEITGVDSDREKPAIFASTAEDYRIAFKIGRRGQVFIQIASPCTLWSEKEAKLTEPNSPNFLNEKLPYPNHEDDFWSVTKPIN